MARDYVHLARQGEEFGWEIRSYSASESTIEHKGKKVLLVEVEAGGCSFCDGSYAHNLTGVNVEGYVTEWQYRRDEQGRAVSLVEPILNSKEQEEIAEILKPRYARSQINFF
ncbi:MAG: hypothetical protein FJZ95_00115 [Chloroflexi bacterium]|nr:hypothetical protein [Chloroflexota bacterium]